MANKPGNNCEVEEQWPPLLSRKQRRTQRRALLQEEEDQTTNKDNLLQVSQEDLLKEIQMLRAQLREEQEENEKERALHQEQYERKYVYAENLQKQIHRLKREKSTAYDKQMKDVRAEVKDELKGQTTANALLRGQLGQVKLQEKELKDQIATLTQHLEKEQVEKQDLMRLVAELQSSLKEKDQTAAAAQTRVDILVQTELQILLDEKVSLESTVAELRSALCVEKQSVEVLHGREKEQSQIIREEKAKSQALNQTLETELQILLDEKVSLESTVAELRSALCVEKQSVEVLHGREKEQSQIIREEKAKSQALNQTLETERKTFSAVIERCHTTYASLLHLKDQLAQKLNNSKQETEQLKVQHQDELSALQSTEENKRALLQDKIRELSEALTSSEQTNQELQDKIMTKEECRENINQKKRRGWFTRFFCRT
ncbi:trichohyalin-like [Boleophthalmus pectinirostris]|uniref:trichohyalin-like n=1 Tax=Boleophthalmus pectinirostris TaxID=150288 RepID=UPI00242FCE4A|nr:trichohyalin-like [Boleophthalmus pectinirostris]